MLSSAVKKYADFYGVVSGKKNVFFTNNDSAYESALCLHNKGIKVEAVIDIRESSNSKIVKAVEECWYSNSLVSHNCRYKGYKRLNVYQQ